MSKHKLAVAALLVALLLAVISNASADEGYPDSVEVLRIEDCNLVCVVFPDGSGECYECGGQCELPTATPVASYRPTATDVGDTVEPSVVPSGTYTAIPATDTPRPTVVLTPTLRPEPSRTPVVEPTKVHCDKGGGNGEEGCDPGNRPDNGNDDED